ncbi:Thioredoxin domain-containing protein [Sulfitobacter noctilucicola]|uniref:Thiol:disulfide interchange protein n=1 Tax=Sulfitobacter noctilucicola TaxID=1342301 RepID=A0A7W6Q4C5_9RHOB|nr:thioredoxin family protein [Sulfitobacter noctilucicola]KIN63367.1 Thioredoxin domain-containing protein [Sulfitobacter noctilucicola]MBB4175115.1 thiol:disulfide interchange protein [Sulfitobacter noctilucicola]
MNRRTFIVTAAAAASAAMLPRFAFAADYVEYTPGVIEAALAEGKTVFVDYSATWCGTCKRQERVIESLRSADPAYDKAMTFVKVDWDTYKNADVTVFREIPRRSTLIVLRGEDELGRIVAGTSEKDIKGLLDTGL